MFEDRLSPKGSAMLDLSVAIADHLRECFYMNGQWVRSHSTRRAALVSLVTEREVLSLPLADATDVDRAPLRRGRQR